MNEENLHAYQHYCVDWIIDHPACGVYIEMGMGKTVITLTAINELKYFRFETARVLIIAPKKVAEATWSYECSQWDHLKHLKVAILVGDLKYRQAALQSRADVYVINRDNVKWLVDQYRTPSDWPFDMVVLDESSSFKNSQAIRYKALKYVRPNIKRLVELTGTPTPNGMMDLWAQMFLLDGGTRLGRFISRYREAFFKPDKRNQFQIFSWKLKPGAQEEIMNRVSDICISMQAADYLQLPDFVVQTVPVHLDDKAAAAYRQLERDMILELADDELIEAGSAAVLTGKLLQLCNGAVYDSDGKVQVIHDCKLDALVETIEQLNGEHCLLFYTYIHDKDRILKRLSGAVPVVRVYTGSQDLEDWNAGKIDVLLAHPASCAYGLNLQHGGRHIIWFGLTWSLEQYQQANARLYRQGQEKPVVVHILTVTGGMDEDVVKSLSGKQDTQDALLNALKARIDIVRRNISE